MMQEQIIQFLKESDGYISGEEISVKLKISRAAIWKHMQELRAEGYEIAAVPHLGYRLVVCPDKLLSYEITSGLGTRTIGRQVVVLDTVTSTMDEAFRMGMDNCPEGAVVCAEAQSKGRGRLGRAWSSPKGKGLYFSVVLRPQVPLNQLAQLTLMSAVALAEAIETTSGLKVLIKWPNDILFESHKLAGILTELRAESDQVKFVVLGIGLNVNSSLNQLAPQATSLKLAAGRSFNRTQVLQAVLRCLDKGYARLLRHEWPTIMQEWLKHSATINKRVRITDAAGTVEGEAVDLDGDGALLIRKDNGLVVRKTAGDIFLLR
ncbi:MAG: biotin--[acetyl-CoA-carboxylase] ligase [Candidatus Omnitrophica bacterium]|nr:biotin--[acetyl-CoA-carboxylase] ligase [Candidatus Omnitrophota bacterium]